MKHLDAAKILSVRDGESVEATVRQHLDGCATCAASVASARARSEQIERMLAALDGPVEATAAKAGVRARLREATADPAPLRGGGRHLGRAAILVLLTAGAAAALPWSPVGILFSPKTSTATEERADAARVADAPAAASADRPAGIAVAVDGSVHVVVRGAAPGAELSVAWTDQSSARLTAPPGSRFTYASGRVEVDASRGAVLIELPRSASAVSLDVDGRPYLRGSASALDVPGPVVEQTDDTIRFRVDNR